MPSPLLAPSKKPAGRGRAPSRGSGLRIAGLPAPVLLGGVVLAVAIGLYIRHRSGSSTSSTTAAPALADTGASGGGSSSGSASGPDYTPFYGLADSINGLTGILGGGGTFQISSSGGVPTSPAAPVSGMATLTTVDPPPSPYTSGGAGAPGGSTATSSGQSGGIPVPSPSATSAKVGAGYGTAVGSAVGAVAQKVPVAPHSTATKVTPAPPKQPVSGYAQSSHANLH